MLSASTEATVNRPHQPPGGIASRSSSPPLYWRGRLQRFLFGNSFMASFILLSRLRSILHEPKSAKIISVVWHSAVQLVCGVGLKGRECYRKTCKYYDEYDDLQKLLRDAEAVHSALFNKATADITNGTLRADSLISELFSKAENFEVDDNLYRKAMKRFRLGNPPGKKKDTIGDEVNWETLIDKTPDGEDLHLVSGDTDYAAVLANDKVNPALELEWISKKKSALRFYKNLQDFLHTNYADIKLAYEAGRLALIEELAKSRSFISTHLAINRLRRLDEFSPAQVEQLINIAATNTQVKWIFEDIDVGGFYENLKAKYAENISLESRKLLDELLTERKAVEDNDGINPDIPF